ncbi:MAG: phage tail assembly protein [Myxococcales bacterium]|nr:phage tail assembly protein [Myxococcales bacterium]
MSTGYIENRTLIETLGLDEEATSADILDKLEELRTAAGEKFESASGDVRLIRAGQHPHAAHDPIAGTVTVTLQCPFTYAKDTIRELVLREPAAKDLQKMGDAKGTTAGLILIASASGRNIRELGDMKQRDIKVASAALAFLSTTSPPTGPS